MFVSGSGTTPWLTSLNGLPGDALLGISTHVQPFPHPDPDVIQQIKGRKLYRSEEHSHITVATENNQTTVKYSHE